MPSHHHLDRVEIRRFRGLSELDLDGLGRFNVLLGANDVGKTSVLEALFLLTGFANLTVPVRIQQWRRLPIDRFEHFEALFHQIDPDQPIELVAHSGGAIVRRTLRISAPYTELEVDPEAPASAGGGDGRSRTSASVGPAGGQSSSSLLSARRRHLRYDVTVQPRDGDADSYSAMLRRREDGFQVKQSAEPADEATISARYMTPAVDYDGAAIGDLIVRKEVGRLVQFLKEVNPRIRDVAASGDLVYLDIGLDRMVPLNLFGSGMVRAASVLSHCMLANERLLFLDELENGLHHAAVRPLLEALLVLSRDQDMQVFVTTHSVTVLQSLLDVLGCDGFASHRPTTHCYTLKRDREGRVRPTATSTRSSSTACDTGSRSDELGVVRRGRLRRGVRPLAVGISGRPRRPGQRHGGGVSKLRHAENEIRKRHHEGRRVALPLDADTDTETTRDQLAREVRRLGLPIERSFLLPDNTGGGDLETLLEQMAPAAHRGVYGCFDQYEECLRTADCDYTIPNRKARVYAYCHAVGAKSGPDKNYADAVHWDPAVPGLAPLRRFLRDLNRVDDTDVSLPRSTP